MPYITYYRYFVLAHLVHTRAWTETSSTDNPQKVSHYPQKHITQLTRQIGIDDEQEQLTDSDTTPFWEISAIIMKPGRTLDMKLIGMLITGYK